ncbi:MAG: D-glycero-beta-D-manno-heptose 1-phosphate adenylyltransferase [Bacteriovoracales bacterium]|nr:D-glycero-beta-D-manno-heptose 1-phosphate adenylyltransferase [Bacteriovoracales bacterium]
MNEKTQGIVFTNGCFDLIHSGHISYLKEAKSKGHYLIVGLNSDTSVKKIKGNTRPINNQSDRKFVLENLKPVDQVIIFDEETPYELIKKIKPDILVKGGDWKVEDIVGHDIVLKNGGRVESLHFVEDRSTTSIIDKIRLQYIK